jgi:hypothetical protein
MHTAEAFLAVFESEPWATARATVSSGGGPSASPDTEELVEAANSVYRLISKTEASWQNSVASGVTAYREDEDRQFGDLYRRWSEVCKKYVPRLRELARGESPSEGLDELLGHFEEADALLAARELEASMRPIEEILPLAAGNPRPERYGL